jgi:cysteine desulfurase / selenocysteine lyase
MDLAYMDFAATAAVRPPAVADAVADYIREIGASPGRGGHRLAISAGRVALRCRQLVAELLDLPGDAGRVTFTANATYALNQALWGTLRRGDVLVVSVLDHNAVLRPAAALARERGIDVRTVPARSDGTLDDDAFQAALPGARVAVINAASNVLGTAVDVTRLCDAARAAGVLSLVDAAQAAGHVPFSGAAADMVAFSGHKGMLGPQGIGGLWVRAGVEIEPLLTGGTGGDSLQRQMPTAFPDHLEAGTLNGPAMAGLIAGVETVLVEGVAALHLRLAALKHTLWYGLAGIAGIEMLSPPAPLGTPIVLVRSGAVDAATLAARLDREHGVLTRSGLHCAPDAHRLLGSENSGGVRFSLGWASTEEHVQRAITGVEAILTHRFGAAPWRLRSEVS